MTRPGGERSASRRAEGTDDVVGLVTGLDVVKFGRQGEWAEERTLAVQFQNIKGNSVDEFRDPKVEVIIYPPQYKSGEVVWPYNKARE